MVASVPWQLRLVRGPGGPGWTGPRRARSGAANDLRHEAAGREASPVGDERGRVLVGPGRPRRALRRRATTAGWSSSGTRCRGSGCGCGSPRAATATGSCAATPSRCSSRPRAPRPPPCPFAGPGRCGGCDFQHVALPEQRALKAAVVREQLARLAGLDVAVDVEPVPGDTDGLRWRTRVEFAVDRRRHGGAAPAPLPRRHRRRRLPHRPRPGAGRRRARSPLAGGPGRRRGGPGAGDTVVVPVPSGGGRAGGPRDGPRGWLGGRLRGQRPRVLAGAPRRRGDVRRRRARGARAAAGERAVDLYAGVGLFARALADAVGRSPARSWPSRPTGRGDRDARRNLAVTAPRCELRPGKVDRVAATAGAPGDRRRPGRARPAADRGRRAGDRRRWRRWGRARSPTSRATRPRSPATWPTPARPGYRPAVGAGVRRVPDDAPRGVHRDPRAGTVTVAFPAASGDHGFRHRVDVRFFEVDSPGRRVQHVVPRLVRRGHERLPGPPRLRAPGRQRADALPAVLRTAELEWVDSLQAGDHAEIGVRPVARGDHLVPLRHECGASTTTNLTMSRAPP